VRGACARAVRTRARTPNSQPRFYTHNITRRYEDIGHSQNAQSTLASYKVGNLNAEDAAKCEAENKEKKKGGAGVGIFAVIAVAVVAAGVYYFQVVMKQPTQ
jgi:hypothetical protein